MVPAIPSIPGKDHSPGIRNAASQLAPSIAPFVATQLKRIAITVTVGVPIKYLSLSRGRPTALGETVDVVGQRNALAATAFHGIMDNASQPPSGLTSIHNAAAQGRRIPTARTFLHSPIMPQGAKHPLPSGVLLHSLRDNARESVKSYRLTRVAKDTGETMTKASIIA
ncbi:hypothetical protein MKZ38_003630 [Zalerion maritima]|uniref:Uncharacterized protein n=1 Tax=Zalerion maritima TaxID=339359 RepID=A0AAD5RNP4_9PEZI|nr:hypothetical protein MKZ38_003630 [Zalerion maritima]